jgi:hypothetical protein
MPLTPPPGLSVHRSRTANAVAHRSENDINDLNSGQRSPTQDDRLRLDVSGDHGADTPLPVRTNRELLAENDALRSMLAALPVIEQAKGSIMLTHGVSADDAFALLHRFAEPHNISVRDLAGRLLHALSGERPNSTSMDTMASLLTELASHPTDFAEPNDPGTESR